MSLYGSLFSGVTGINSQGTAISSISNNISNINTVGYKTEAATFSSLVTGSTGLSSASGGGGALARTRSAIDGQGLIQPTGVSTDVAISGKGFMVVNDKNDGTGTYLYTRAGSFRTDSRGNLQNAAGYYLQAWPLDNQALLPGEPGNLDTKPNARLDSLVIVNTRGSTVAQATTKVSFGHNLKATEQTIPGQGADIVLPVSVADFNGGPTFTSTSVIAPGGTSGLATGESFAVRINGTNTTTFNYGGFAESVDVTVGAGILGATTTSGSFSIGATDELDILRISSTSSGTVDFTLSNSPDPINGRFNSLQTLADAINNTPGLTARVTNNRLYVSSRDANDAVTFTNVDGPNLGGATDIVGELGIASFAGGLDRFNTFDGLKNVIATKSGITSTITSTTSDPKMRIFATDPLATIEFLDVPANSFIGAGDEFGIATGVLDPVYNALNVGGNNIASGKIKANIFSRNITLFDGLGVGHDFIYSAAKIGNNQWAAELYAATPTEIVSTRSDGLVASGTLTFNGDGSLRNVSAGLLQNVEIAWANQAIASEITLNFGTAGQPVGTVGATEIGKTDGVTQFDGSNDVRFIDQDGAGAGLLTSVSIDKDGIISFNYSNGQSRKVYKIPLADFPNINGLGATTGNAYKQSDISGEFTLKQAGQSGAGVVRPESLENSSTELSNELTSMIVAQRSYEANTKTITTVDGLLQKLTDMLR